MRILVINTGSSSIKYRLFDLSDAVTLAAGVLEGVGESSSRLTHRARAPGGDLVESITDVSTATHRRGLENVIDALIGSGVIRDTAELAGVGHRVVHGGPLFKAPTLIDDRVIATIKRVQSLAPMHNPNNLTGIEVFRKLCNDVPQVAVFDTAFHQTMPPHASYYALPYDLCEEHHVRRYGFHGTSHAYVAKEAATILSRPLEELNLITLHLGNGASATAILRGQSVDTSMGMTPLEGLMMGTRSGDIDPALPFYVSRVAGMSREAVEALLNEESGLRGICGQNDMREIHKLRESGDVRATLAIEMYVYRIKKYIGAYLAALGRVDALVFTGGIGENDAWIRARVCAGLEGLGIEIDPTNNSRAPSASFELHRSGSAVAILVIQTNEELEIARQTAAVVS